MNAPFPPPILPAHLALVNASAGYPGHPAIHDMSIEIPSGALVAVVGPNGAGKSTLFKLLVGLLPLRSGQALIHGLPAGSHQDCVAYVPQREEVDWRFPVNVLDVVLMGRYGRLGWLKSPTPQDRQVALEALRQMDMVHLAGRPIGDLSGGQQQRVFLARALAQEPHILLLDEPFTGVDITTQEVTLRLLADLHQKGVTVMVSTHDLKMASQYFETVIMLNKRLIAYGPPAQVFTPDLVNQAFQGHLLMLDSAVVVDDCCGHEHIGEEG